MKKIQLFLIGLVLFGAGLSASDNSSKMAAWRCMEPDTQLRPLPGVRGIMGGIVAAGFSDAVRPFVALVDSSNNSSSQPELKSKLARVRKDLVSFGDVQTFSKIGQVARQKSPFAPSSLFGVMSPVLDNNSPDEGSQYIE